MTERPSLLDLSELEDDLVPEILPSSASLSVNGTTSKMRALFSRAAAVAPTKEMIPGTAHALLEAFPATAGQLPYVRVTASDGEQTVTVIEEGLAVRVPGSVLLPPKRVLDILRLAPTESVDLSVVGTVALVRSGRARWSVQTPVGEISALSDLSDVGEVSLRPVPVPSFLKALKIARVAASTTNARGSLMQVHVKDSTITACDGGRIHRAYAQGLPDDIDVTIPVGVVDELIRTLEGTEDPTMEFGFDDRTLVFQVTEGSIVARRLLLPFPDLSTLVLRPKLANTLHMQVERKELLEAIRRVRVNADPDIAVVTLSTVKGTRSADHWILEVSSRDRAGNTANETVECGWDGGQISVTFNHHHLTDLLEVCVPDVLSLTLGQDTKSNKNPLYSDDGTVVGVLQQVTQHWL